MKFEKGHSKQGGRQAGTFNRTTSDIRSKIAALIDDQFEQIKGDLETLDPKERVTAYLKFLEYVLPKQREQKIDLSTLTDAELDQILEKALTKLNHN